jgi:hypothetical protein
MDERTVPQPHDLVLDVQFSPLQFYDLKIVSGWVGECLDDFLFQRLVPFLKFRKMRFNRHVVFLPCVGFIATSIVTPHNLPSLYSVYGPAEIPGCAPRDPCGGLTKTR